MVSCAIVAARYGAAFTSPFAAKASLVTFMAQNMAQNMARNPANRQMAQEPCGNAAASISVVTTSPASLSSKSRRQQA